MWAEERKDSGGGKTRSSCKRVSITFLDIFDCLQTEVIPNHDILNSTSLNHHSKQNLSKIERQTKRRLIWVSHITYLRIPTAFVYSAVILDLHSRKVIGYYLSRHIYTKFTLSGLRIAIKDRNRAPRCIYHSGENVQYPSSEYVKERYKDMALRSARPGKAIPNGNALTGFVAQRR